jgi:hypothetical protein
MKKIIIGFAIGASLIIPLIAGAQGNYPAMMDNNTMMQGNYPYQMETYGMMNMMGPQMMQYMMQGQGHWKYAFVCVISLLLVWGLLISVIVAIWVWICKQRK